MRERKTMPSLKIRKTQNANIGNGIDTIYPNVALNLCTAISASYTQRKPVKNIRTTIPGRFP